MHSNERRRTGRVHRHRRPLKAKHIGKPPRCCAERAASTKVGVDTFNTVFKKRAHRVIATHQTGKHSGPTTAQALGRAGGVFQRLPCYLEQQPLLWIEMLGFARSDAKKFGVELVDAFEKRTLAADYFPGHIRIRVIVGISVPPVGGHGPDRVNARSKNASKGLEIVSPARKPTRRANNRNWRPGRLLALGQLGTQRADARKRLSEQRGDVWLGTHDLATRLLAGLA